MCHKYYTPKIKQRDDEAMLVIIANNTQTIESKNIIQAGVKDTIKSYHFKSSSTFFGLSKREFKETSLKEQAQYALVNSDANLSYKALSSLILEGVRVNAKGISLGAKTLEIKPLVLESIETKEWSKGTLLSPSFMQESLKRVSLAPSFIESKDLSINTLSTTIKASHIKARDISINTQALDLMSLKNRETKNSFSSNASSFLLAKNTKEGFIKEVAMPSTLSFSNSFMLNGRELSKEVQELSNRSNFIAKDKESKAKDNHNPLIISSEMPLALDSSILFSKALLENKQWSERSKSLTPLSHLLLEAALAYVSAGINLPIHSTFVSGVAKGSMQGALGSGVFQVSNKLIDSKNALSFRSFTKDTLAGGIKGGVGLLPLNPSWMKGLDYLPVGEIGLKASIDSLIYKEGFKESLLENSLVALGNSLFKGVGDIGEIQSSKGNSLFKEGGLGKVVLHSGVGGVMAALNKENFFKGALISGIYESIAPLRGNPIEHKEREILISKVYGGVVGGLLGGNSLMALGSALSESAERYNRELHYNDYVVATDGIEDNKVVQLTKEEYEEFLNTYFPTQNIFIDILGDNAKSYLANKTLALNNLANEKYIKQNLALLPNNIMQNAVSTFSNTLTQNFANKNKLPAGVSIQDGIVIFDNPITREFTNKDLNLNNPKDFEILRRQAGVNYANLNSKVIIATGMLTDTATAQRRVSFTENLLGQQVGLIHNQTEGVVSDTREFFSNGFTTRDSLTAYKLRQMTRDSTAQTRKIVAAHSAGNKDIYKANRLNAHKGLITNYYLLSLGSPVSENPLRDSINAVGGEFVGQVNHPYDFIIQSVNWNTETSEPPYPNTFRSESNNFVTRYLENTHGYEMYLMDYGIKDIIENIMRENAMKENSEKELSNGKN